MYKRQDILNEKSEYDAIILIRGGGSKLDLAAFDTYKLCEKLANMPFPVITGIGHDIDPVSYTHLDVYKRQT